MALWADEEWVKAVISTLLRSVVFGEDEECSIERASASQVFGSPTITFETGFKTKHGVLVIRNIIDIHSTVESAVESVLVWCADSLFQFTQDYENGHIETGGGMMLQNPDRHEDEPWMSEHKRLYG